MALATGEAGRECAGLDVRLVRADATGLAACWRFDDGGTDAEAIGIRTLDLSVSLSRLNGYRGIHPIDGQNDIRILADADAKPESTVFVSGNAGIARISSVRGARGR